MVLRFRGCSVNSRCRSMLGKIRRRGLWPPAQPQKCAASGHHWAQVSMVVLPTTPQRRPAMAKVNATMDARILVPACLGDRDRRYAPVSTIGWNSPTTAGRTSPLADRWQWSTRCKTKPRNPINRSNSVLKKHQILSKEGRAPQISPLNVLD